MKTYENDYVEYILDEHDDAEKGIYTYKSMLNDMTRRGREGWKIINAWPRNEFVKPVISVVWQRKANANN